MLPTFPIAPLGAAIALLLALWYPAPPAAASPLGTVYRPFLDAPVTDGLGNEAGETHRTLAGIPFDELPDPTVQNLVLSAPPGSAFLDPPAPIWFDERETPVLGGSVLDLWAIGDIADPTVPIFTNAVATGSGAAFNVTLGIENLFWAGTSSAAGDAAVLGVELFELGFADGSVSVLTPLFSGVVFGAGTEDSPLLYFAEFAPSDFAGSPTSLHAVLSFSHVPEPGTAGLLLAGLALLAWGRR